MYSYVCIKNEVKVYHMDCVTMHLILNMLIDAAKFANCTQLYTLLCLTIRCSWTTARHKWVVLNIICTWLQSYWNRTNNILYYCVSTGSQLFNCTNILFTSLFTHGYILQNGFSVRHYIFPLDAALKWRCSNASCPRWYCAKIQTWKSCLPNKTNDKGRHTSGHCLHDRKAKEMLHSN